MNRDELRFASVVLTIVALTILLIVRYRVQNDYNLAQAGLQECRISDWSMTTAWQKECLFKGDKK